MSRTVPEKASLPKGTPIFRNDRDPQPCSFADRECGTAVAIVANHRVCQRHLDRIASIAEDARVPFHVETAA